MKRNIIYIVVGIIVAVLMGIFFLPRRRKVYATIPRNRQWS